MSVEGRSYHFLSHLSPYLSRSDLSSNLQVTIWLGHRASSRDLPVSAPVPLLWDYRCTLHYHPWHFVKMLGVWTQVLMLRGKCSYRPKPSRQPRTLGLLTWVDTVVCMSRYMLNMTCCGVRKKQKNWSSFLEISQESYWRKHLWISACKVRMPLIGRYAERWRQRRGRGKECIGTEWTAPKKTQRQAVSGILEK